MAAAAITRVFLLLATTSLRGARGGVADTVLGQSKAVEAPAATASAPATASTASAPAPSDASAFGDEAVPEMLRTPATGDESLVMCSGRQVCHGEALLGGMRVCAEGLDCADLAVILLQGGKSSMAEAAGDVESMAPVAAEATAPSASLVGADASTNNVYICHGHLLCHGSTFVRFGRLWCVGGYQCVP